MKKLVALMFVALLATTLAAAPARAIELEVGPDMFAKFNDWSNLYQPLVGAPYAPRPLSGQAPALGDELRSILQVTTIQNQDTLEFLWNAGAGEELTGILYDLELVQIIAIGNALLLDFAPLGRNPLTGTGSPAAFGGVLEVYADSPADFTPNPGGLSPKLENLLPLPAPYIPPVTSGPYYWTEGAAGHAAGAAGADTYPGTSDGSLWLAGVFVDYLTAGIPPHPGPDGILGTADDVAHHPATVWSEVFDLTTGSGEATGYLHGVGGSFLSSLELNKYGPYMEIELGGHMAFPRAQINPGPDGILGTGDDFLELVDVANYAGVGHWQVDSWDPANFGTIPEPATLSLLGVGLVSLVGVGLRRRKRA
jgi:hypothetical protein